MKREGGALVDDIKFNLLHITKDTVAVHVCMQNRGCQITIFHY